MSLLIDAALGLLVIGIIIMVIVGLIIFIRKRNSYLVSIERDYRNPGMGRRTFYAIYNKQAKQYDLYSNLLKMTPDRGMANVDLKAFADNFGKVPCVRGITGKPGDDMIVPVGLPLLSQAAALEYANQMSDSVTSVFHQAAVAWKKLSPIPNKEAFTAEQKLIAALSKDDIKTMLSPTMMAYIKYALSPQWVMDKLGIHTVLDGAIMTIPQKQAMGSINSRTNEFILQQSSWWDQHYGVFMSVMVVVIMAVVGVLILYGAGQYFSTLGQSIPGIVSKTVQSSYNSSLHIYGFNLTGYVPK